ncbi:MAG: PQQ-binding-like beta-propeller repeat protein, partial [Thermoguttaceae bacterium]
PAPAEGTQSTPAVYDGRVYTLGRFGQICCLDAADGRPIWSHSLLRDFGGKLRPYSGYACSPLVLQNVVIVHAGGDALVLALDRKTGHLAWKSGPGAGAAESSPVPYDAGGKPGVVMLTPKVALGLNAVSGDELWRYPWKGGGYTIPTPLVHGDRVLLSVFPRDGLSLMLQLTSSGPKEVWKTKGMGLLFHSGVLVDGHVYGPYSNSGEADTTLLQCVSWDTGEVKWTHAGFGFSPLVAADGKLILITDDGELVVAEASPKAYKELARAKVFPSKSKSWVCPVLCGGRIYCRGGENAVCLDVKRQ